MEMYQEIFMVQRRGVFGNKKVRHTDHFYGVDEGRRRWSTTVQDGCLMCSDGPCEALPTGLKKNIKFFIFFSSVPHAQTNCQFDELSSWILTGFGGGVYSTES